MAIGRTNAATRRRGMFTFTVGDTVYKYDGKNDLDNSAIKTMTNNTTKTFKCWIKTSGTLYFKTLPKSKKARAFACGAGGNGGVNYGAYASHYCGRGGQGGRTSSSNSIDLIARSQLAIVVGSSDTSGFGLLAAKGLDSSERHEGVGAGGVGGHFYSDPYFGGTTYYVGASGTDGVYAFDDSSFDGIKYGGGGGGGEAGISGGNAGGLTGGGHGYGQGVTSMDGTANTGGGGGGGPLNDNVSGTGGTGIFIFETLEAES